MAHYRVVLSKSVMHDVRGIDLKHTERIYEAIRSLQEDPFPRGHKKLMDSESSYRVRVGNYRILYQVDISDGLVTVFHVRHRKDAYR